MQKYAKRFWRPEFRYSSKHIYISYRRNLSDY